MGYRRIARRMHFIVHQDMRDIIEQWFVRFALLQTGHSRRAPNLISGRFRNVETRIFDYHYTTDAGGMRAATIVAFRITRSRITAFTFWPRESVEARDIVLPAYARPVLFADNPDFAQRFDLFSGNGEPVHHLFHPRVQRWLEMNPHWSIHAGGDWVLLYRANHRCPTARLPELLWQAYQTFRQFRLS